MIGSTALLVLNTPYRLMATTRSQSASLLSTNGPTLSQPALLTRTSMRPNRSLTVATMAATDSRSVTSTRRPTWRSTPAPPSSLAVVTADCSSTSVTTTIAPSLASFSAMPRPMPRPADDRDLLVQLAHDVL